MISNSTRPMTAFRFGTGVCALLGTAALSLLCRAASADIVNFSMTLDGSQETPAVDTPATGSGTATLNTATNQFSWNISFSGLSAGQTAAHFHGAGMICVAAGVQIALPLGSPIIGSATVSPSQAADIMAGLYYVNVHTTAHPGGEIRAQVEPAPVDNPVPAPIPSGAIHLKLETLATGLVAPNWGINAPGVANRLFVVDQTGQLWSINTANGAKTVFLDVSSLLVPLGIFGPGSYDERGFLGVAFHPDYQNNGLLYTFTSQPVKGTADFSTMPPSTTPDCQTVIAEWHVNNPTDPNSVADPNSARELLRIDKPQFNHNAGAMNFGPDGKLYIALGDGGGADDKDLGPFIGPPIIGHGCTGNGQNLAAALGKILRIDQQGSNSANGNYGIPTDNPFFNQGGVVKEIYAYGFRNPFRFSFDSTSGAMYIGDVGQNDLEEIDLGVSGGNFGWRLKEGSFFFVPNGNSDGYVTDVPQSVPAGLIDPIAQYDHGEGIAVLGGFVYRGTRIVPLNGKYVFGELARTFNADGRLFYLAAGNQVVEFQLVGQSGLNLFLLGFGQDANGELYIMANSTGSPGGTTGVVLHIATKPGDLNADGVVNVDDLLTVINGWGPCPAPPALCPGDANHDGTVNVDDLLMVINNWG